MQDFLHTFCEVGRVRPPNAMGTFLRVWRSAWARLSRAQLAHAVQGHLNGRHSVTPDVIRWWEMGQPPASTEELEALCIVMRAHELSEGEVEQFRAAVFAACAGRQYPDLFGDDGFAHSPHVARTSAQMMDAGTTPGADAGDLVPATARIEALRAALQGKAVPEESAAQRRRQEAALACLRALCAVLHYRAGRNLLGGTEAAATAAFVRSRFGTGEDQANALSAVGVSGLSSTWLQAWEARNLFLVYPGPTYVDRLLALARAARDADEQGADWAAYLSEAMCYAADIERLDLLETARDMIGDHLPACRERCDPNLLAIAHRGRFLVALSAGRIGDAEAHACELQCLNRPGPSVQSEWQWYMGRLAFARGRHEEAIEHFQRGLGAAGRASIVVYERQIALDIETCERRLLGEEGSSIPPFYTPPAR